MKTKKEAIKSHWMNVADAAKHLKISKETVYRMLEKKKIPAHRIGKLWRFNEKEIDVWAMKK